MKNDNYHESVMTHEVMRFLHLNKQAWYIDATLGNGGHTIEILNGGGKVLGIEADPNMLEIARERINSARKGSTTCPAHENFKGVVGNFKDIDKIAKANGLEKASGIVFDLGVTNLHLTSKSRGFSFREPETALDMRLSENEQGVTGADLLNLLRADQLTTMFRVTMPFSQAKILTDAVIANRNIQRIETVGDFLKTMEGIKAKEDLHFATLPFLALRIAVNTELDNLKEALPKAFDLLEIDASLVVISFHSREDEIVEKFFKSRTGKDGKEYSREFIKPSLEEVYKNTRARSARLRSLKKIK